MCVINVNMKTATTREVQHHFSNILDWVAEGEEVIVTRRGKRVARVTRYEEPDEQEVIVPDFRELRKKLGTDSNQGQNEILRMRDESL